MAAKVVIVHAGPHKTGSTALQAFLEQSKDRLRHGNAEYYSGSLVSEAAQALAYGRYNKALFLFQACSKEIAKVKQSTIVVSHEDFSGQLLGRAGEVRVYPHLRRCLSVISLGLVEHDVRFYVFERSMDEWLQSVYHQNLRWRSDFGSFETFKKRVSVPASWDVVFASARQVLGSQFHVLKYDKEPSSGAALLLSAVDPALNQGASAVVLNTSPPIDLVRQFERINNMAEHKELIPVYKMRAEKAQIETLDASQLKVYHDGPTWPVSTEESLITTGLEALNERATSRVSSQDRCDDVLPWVQVDLKQAASRILPRDVVLPNVSRRRMEDQVKLLRYYLRGKSELALLNAVAISYLRRDTAHTATARMLFQRLWAEHGLQLAYELSTRWLISTLQTFGDHGASDDQRQIGYAGYFYGNMIKIYEGERSLEGLDNRAIYKSSTPAKGPGFRGLDRFNLGGTDLMLNTNALLLELARREPCSGLVLAELLLRVKVSPTAFSRLDRSRQALGVNVTGFSDTWSFFEEPSNQ